MSTAEIELAATLVGVNLGLQLGELVVVIGGGDYLTLTQIRQRIETFSKSVSIKSN